MANYREITRYLHNSVINPIFIQKRASMVAVITADIENSRQEQAAEWLPLLKEVLTRYGESPKQWEIFRGDSFQLVLSPEQAFRAAIHIKAGIKLIKNLDVRIGIGIGEEDHSAENITESNGSAYVRSGECFESLKKQNLRIVTPDPDLNETLNLLFSLALLSMNTWSPVVAGVIKTALENPGKSQKELAEILDRSQSSISEALNRGGFDEVMQLNEYYLKQLVSL